MRDGGVRPVPLLLTVRQLHIGGIERDAAKLAIHIDRRRFTPHVAVFEQGGMRYDEILRHGIPVLHLPVRSYKSPLLLRAAFRWWRYIRQHRIQVVHAMDNSSVYTVPLSRLCRVPAVLSSMLGSRLLFDERTRKQLRWTDTMVDTVVVNCEAMRRHMIEEGVPDERIAICYNGVDRDLFYPRQSGVDARVPLVKDASLVIGSLCALRPEKALHLLQDAFALVRHLKKGMKLLLVGSGDELPRLQQNAARLGLGDACIFQPTVSDVAPFLRSMDIFVLPSLSEAFSNALLEAMACGCSVIGSRVGGMPELTGSSEERGLLFESGNVPELAAKLERLIHDSELRTALGQRAAQWAHTTLSIQANAKRSADIYDSVLDRKLP